MQRKLTISSGGLLWDKGDASHTIAYVEAGRLGVRIGGKLLGIVWPEMVLGESSILAIEGDPGEWDAKARTITRTATVFALDNDTKVVEYPASLCRQLFESGDTQLAVAVLRNLVGQICRNCLLILSSPATRGASATAVKGLLLSSVQPLEELASLRTWLDFMRLFHHYHGLREHTSVLLPYFITATSERSDIIMKASAQVHALFADHDLLGYLVRFLEAEGEKEALTRQL
jgi:hypothetical protein